MTPSPPKISLCGLTFEPHPSGAAYCLEHDALLVADLHFEKGSSRASRGVHLPPYDTASTLATLEHVTTTFSPAWLILLGDSFHDVAGPDRLGDDDRQRIERLADDCDIIWITGNHDRALPATLGGTVVNELAFGGLTLRHEPVAGAVNEVAGHLHPAASLVQRGRKVKRRCFIADDNRMILPAFGAYTGGLNITDAAFRPLFPGDRFAVWMTGNGTVHRFPAQRFLHRQT